MLIDTVCYKKNCKKRLGCGPKDFDNNEYGLIVFCKAHITGVPECIMQGGKCDQVEPEK